MDEKIILKLAEDIADRISGICISELQKITDTLSGDDSELENAWDEICVQVKGEHSIYWSAYEETAEMYISLRVDKLKEHEKEALWALIVKEHDLEEYDDEEEDYRPLELNEHKIVYFILGYLFRKAEDSPSKRARAYLDAKALARHAEDRCN